MILRPGKQPPFLVPYCAICELPVAEFTYMPVKSEYYLEVEGQCCGKTQGIRLPREQVIEVRRTNRKLFLVQKNARQHQGVYELRRSF